MQDALKGRYHGLWNRYFFSNLNSRLALPWTALFIALKFPPNAITLLSFAVSLAGMYLIAFDPFHLSVVTGAVLLMVGLLWDHCDGQVARKTGTTSATGALLDTVLDRWVETGWIIAIGAGAMLGNPRPLILSLPIWLALATAAWAVHAQLYVRWANVQRDLYIIRKELMTAHQSAAGNEMLLMVRPPRNGHLPVTTFYLPIAFNRDLSLWMLFVITIIPAWNLGLLIFAALHTLLGLEKNWYTYRDLKRGGHDIVSSMLDPDYHK